MKLLTIYGSVDDFEKGTPAFKAYVVDIKSQRFSCVQTTTCSIFA